MPNGPGNSRILAHMNIAIIIPAYNEEATIRNVILDFHKEAPNAAVHVIDNNSSDHTGEIARQTITELNCMGGVFRVTRQGKANAVRWAFRHIDADIYVLVDADSTYPAKDIHKLVALVAEGEADMAVGNRLAGDNFQEKNPRRFHHVGNRLVCGLINLLFDADLKDIMSGYRAFSRAFVKNYPIICEGFELETEMVLHALDKRFVIREMPVKLESRPAGSQSKLHTFRDGWKVLKTIFWIFRHYRPLAFFGWLAFAFFVAGLATGAWPIYEYLRFNYVFKVPSAILASGLMVFSLVSFAIGLILDTIATHERMQFERQFLQYRGGPST